MQYKSISELNTIFDELWPICRSITGPGIKKSLDIISKYVPLEIKSVKSGTKVFDWTIPEEWELVNAKLEDEDGNVVINTDENNLHILNFSERHQGEYSFEELEPFLYTDSNMTSAIPYVTSYYKRRWGFCLSEDQKNNLDRTKKYKVNIDTNIYSGQLQYGEAFLAGKSNETVLISSYLCHPSMANNELSGPLALIGLYNKIKQDGDRYYNYKFLLIPETIGSLAFLHNSLPGDLKKITAGIVLTCLGGPTEKLSIKKTRRAWLGENQKIDYIADLLQEFDFERFETREFSPTGGSDERQFCSPGINLPVVQIARTLYGEYPEYHTSLDTKEFMSIEKVAHSIELIGCFLDILEHASGKAISKIEIGEPMLSKYGLYPSINDPTSRERSGDNNYDERNFLNNMLKVLSLIDGERDILEMSEFLRLSPIDICVIIQHLIKNEIVEI